MQRRALNYAPEDFDMAAYQFWHLRTVAWPQAGGDLLASSVADRYEMSPSSNARGQRPRPKES
jgi:hypothetical protein